LIADHCRLFVALMQRTDPTAWNLEDDDPMSIRHYNRIVYVVLAGFLLAGAGCGKGKDGDGYQCLPDPWWQGRERDRSALLLRDARDFCRQNSYIDGIPNVLVRAQFEAALHALARAQDVESMPPIALVSTGGLMRNGRDTYVQLWAINPNRETNKVHILARSRHGELVRMLVDLHPKAKDQVYRCQVFLQTKCMPWEMLTSRASSEKDSIIHVSAPNSGTIPFPELSAAAVCLAVEDRTGRLSNFVPVDPLDLVRPPASAPATRNRQEQTGDSVQPPASAP
jgi:hypothetical protein